MSLTSDNGAMLTMPVAPAGYSSGGNGGGWGNNIGGDWFIVLFLIFALMGFGGNGWGSNGGGAATQGALTRGDLCMDMSFNDLQSGVRNINDAVNLGFANLNSTICHQQYDTAMLIGGVTSAVNGGFSALNSTICQQQYDTAAQLNAMNMANMQNANAIQSQIASCCCDVREGISGVNYNLASQSCDTRQTINTGVRDLIDNQNANARAILDKLTSQELAAKDAQIAAQGQKLFAAELAASQAAQNSYLINTLRPFPVAAYQVCNPFTGTYGYQSYGGCGCGA